MSIFSVVGRVVSGAAKGLLKGGPVGAVSGGLGGLIPGGAQPGGRSLIPGGGGPQVPGRCPTGFTMDGLGICVPSFGGGGRGGGCPIGTVWDPGLQACVSPKSPVGERALADQYGEAVVGRYGAGLVPAERMTSVARCPGGTVLGRDGLCYNKGSLRNKDRRWPADRKPLLTGGDLGAIARASRAAARLTAKTKQLQKLGMMKKPAARRIRSGAHAH